MRDLLRERLVTALGIAAIAISVVSLVRPEAPAHSWSRLNTDRYWIRKARNEDPVDVILGGDSRVVFGLSPEAMTEDLPGRRIRNFGFLGAGYSKAYLEALSAALDPRSDERAVVLGVSPRSLVPRVTWTNEFTKVMAMGRWERFIALHLDPILRPLRPIRFKELRRLIAKRPEPTFTFFPDGWIAAEPGSPETLAPRATPDSGSIEPFSTELEHGLFETVRRWRGEGIRVFAFRTPIPPEEARWEAQHFRFDEEGFARQLEGAGGRWLDGTLEEVVVWDESHLDRRSALLLSRKIARQVAQNW